MSTFKALNIESDDESDVEIDDTKELQIEDALKLYQTALKHHADGPDSFDLALEAYQKLFKSDIFQYPESQTELHRIELYGAGFDTEDLWIQDHTTNAGLTTGADGGPSTLPQILHLSHKNYGQFKLEYLTARLGTLNFTLNQIVTDALAALHHFSQALDKDESDLDLWRRTASVGDMLDSKRISRFCLEAILDGDDEGLDSFLALPGLEESLAAERLRELVRELGDQLTIVQGSLPSTGSSRLSKVLKQRLHLYPEITHAERTLRSVSNNSHSGDPSSRTTSLPIPKTWAEVGELLLGQSTVEQNSVGFKAVPAAIRFEDKFPIQHQHDSSSVEISPVSPKAIANDSSLLPDDRNPTSTQTGDESGERKNVLSPESANDVANTLKEEPMSGDVVAAEDAASVALPTRKRSGDVAGLNDNAEEGRTKSKRTRTRESTTAEDNKQALIEANARWEYEQQLNEFQAADDWMFETVGNLFERIGIVGLEAGKEVRQCLQSFSVSTSEESSPKTEDTVSRNAMELAKADIYAFLASYSDHLGTMLATQGEDDSFVKGSDIPGFRGNGSSNRTSWNAKKPMLISNGGLLELIKDTNENWMLTEDVVWQWLTSLLWPRDQVQNTYVTRSWPEELKTMIVRTLVGFDRDICLRASDLLEKQRLHAGKDDQSSIEVGLADFIETIFELHLDIYCLIKQPNSGVELDTVTAQHDRLQRWAELAREVMRLRSITTDSTDFQDSLELRFLWATTFQFNATSDIGQDHVIECMNNLRAVLVTAGDPTIPLYNNAVMPELSIAALDREISRLTTKDFFLKVTSPDVNDPASIIESLEPLLQAIEKRSQASGRDSDGNGENKLPQSLSPELVQYVQNSDLTVRILLWRRLRDAYVAIDYPPMVVSCYFGMIKLVFIEMKARLPTLSNQPDRQVVILKNIGLLNAMIAKTLTLVRGNDNAFECIDEESLKTLVTTFGEILQLVQVFNVSEDSIRVGQTQPPMLPNGLTIASFGTMNTKIHEMQIHIWLIMYFFLKEAISQFQDLFPTSVEDRFDFLRTVHRNLGLRGICGASNRAFVRLLKEEFFTMTHVDGYDSEQAQVLYDLHGLNCFLDPNYELMEHHCVHDAFLDRTVASQVIDLLLVQASKLPMKELIKHSLKDTIDRVHGSSSRKKPTDAIMRNREVYRAFLRSPINPLDLYASLKGEGNELPISVIPKEDALLASKGWYFLMGHLALTKFRSQKRTAPTPTEDVDIAIAFFMQDLEYSMDNWETWFRLAQAYDTKIEESVVWSAEKLNNSMTEVVQLQRAAIHCYTIATALAYRSADLSYETSEKMTELYYDFALRIYASSREPFSMLPFSIEEDEKFLSMPHGIGKGKTFQPLRQYTAWKLAKSLFQRSLKGRSQSWMVHYMLGKCLWKMHSASDEVKGRDTPPSYYQVLSSFTKAIELVPDKKDNREKREPVLEPHYKLVSIVQKLKKRREIDLEEAKTALAHTPYAKNVPAPESEFDLIPYILAILKSIRGADKSNWHHRMIAQSAKLIVECPRAAVVDEDVYENHGFVGAKHELTQQMFTKTMVLQVWRPECERAGRHFVYTARYTRFFVNILERLKDRASLELLARRVRRRPHDVFEHTLVWQDICSAYLRLLRRHAALAEGLETSTFSNLAHEDFVARKGPLEKWMQAQETGASPALDVLREVQELKKINQSLMKPGPIDDLIGDSYAFLFSSIGGRLLEQERQQIEEEESRKPPPAPPAPALVMQQSPLRNPMMSLTHLMNTEGSDDNSEQEQHRAKLSTTQPMLAGAAASSSSAQQQQPPPSSSQPDAAVAPTAARRKVGVGRREIRNCAEACFQKTPLTAAAAAAAAASATLAKNGGVLPRVQVVINTSRHGGDVSSVETSAPGSIHDSADESELSELEEVDADDEREDEVEGGGARSGGDSGRRIESEDTADAAKTEQLRRQRPMFPGLANPIVESRATSEGVETAEEEEEDEEEGDNDDDDEEDENTGRNELSGHNNSTRDPKPTATSTTILRNGEEDEEEAEREGEEEDENEGNEGKQYADEGEEKRRRKAQEENEDAEMQDIQPSTTEDGPATITSA